MKEGESVDLRCHLEPAELQWDFCVWEQVVFIHKSLTDKNQNASLQKEGGRKCSRRRGEEGQCEGLEWGSSCDLTLRSASTKDAGSWTATILGQDYTAPPRVCEVVLEIAEPANVTLVLLASSLRAGKVTSVECQAEGGLPLPVLEAFLEGRNGEGRRALEPQEDPVPGDRSRSFTLVRVLGCFCLD